MFVGEVNDRLITACVFVGEVKLAIDCIDAGREGIVSEIKCKIAGSKTSTFVLIRPDGKLVSKCLQTSVSRTCTIPSGLDKIYRSQLITSNEASVLIMSFNSKVDAGVWTCKAEPQHVHSTCNKTSGMEVSGFSQIVHFYLCKTIILVINHSAMYSIPVHRK